MTGSESPDGRTCTVAPVGTAARPVPPSPYETSKSSAKTLIVSSPTVSVSWLEPWLTVTVPSACFSATWTMSGTACCAR